MNDDKIKSQTIKPIAGNAIPTSEDHPLHILDNQTDPSKKPRKFDVPQKPIRTLEKDMEAEMARLEAAGTPVKKQKSSFFSFKKEEASAPKEIEKTQLPQPVKEKFVTREKPSFYVDKTVLKKEESTEYKINNADTINLNKIGTEPQKVIRTFEKDKEEALSHLKDKVPAIKVFNATPVPVEEEAPRPTKTFEQAVEEFENKKKNAPPMPGVPFIPTAPVVETAPTIQIIEKPKEPQKNLRTFEGDVANNFKTGKSSVLSMAIAENARRDGSENISNYTESHTGRNIFMALASIVLVVSGGVGLYYLYNQSPLGKAPVITQPVSISIIKPDSQKIFSTAATNKLDLIAFISDKFTTNNTSTDTITEFILNQKIGSSTENITGQKFITIAGFNMTDSLKRAVQDKWMIGVYSASGQNVPFIILKTDFFQNAFAGMLKWENTMPEELAVLFNYKNRSVSEKIRGAFKDKVIMNRDIREYISNQGETLLLYTFIDKDTILITTSEVTIPVILDRIEKQTYVR